jgi:WD40 repeat protein
VQKQNQSTILDTFRNTLDKLRHQLNPYQHGHVLYPDIATGPWGWEQLSWMLDPMLKTISFSCNHWVNDTIFNYKGKIYMYRRGKFSIYDEDDGQIIAVNTLQEKYAHLSVLGNSNYFLTYSQAGTIQLRSWNPFVIVKEFSPQNPGELKACNCSSNGNYILLMYPNRISILDTNTSTLIFQKEIPFNYGFDYHQNVILGNLLLLNSIKDRPMLAYQFIDNKQLYFNKPFEFNAISNNEKIAYLASFMDTKIVAVDCITGYVWDSFSMPENYLIKGLQLSPDEKSLYAFCHHTDNECSFVELQVDYGDIKKIKTQKKNSIYTNRYCASSQNSTVHFEALGIVFDNVLSESAEATVLPFLYYNLSEKMTKVYPVNDKKMLYVSTFLKIGTLYSYDLTKGTQDILGKELPEKITDFVVSEKGDFLYSISSEGIMREWDIETKTNRIVLQKEKMQLIKLRFMLNEDYLLLSYKTADTAGYQLLHRKSFECADEWSGTLKTIPDYECTNDTGFFAVIADHSIGFFDLSREIHHSPRLHLKDSVISLHQQSVSNLQIHHDELFFQENEHGFYSWSWRTESIQAILENVTAKENIYLVSDIILGCSDNGSFWIANKHTPHVKEIHLQHTSKITSIFSPQHSTLLITGSEDRYCFWQIQTELKLLATMQVKRDSSIIWFTPPDDIAPFGWFCGPEKMIGTFVKNTQNGEILHSLKGKEREEYLALYHNPEMVFAKINDLIHHTDYYEQIMRHYGNSKEKLNFSIFRQLPFGK